MSSNPLLDQLSASIPEGGNLTVQAFQDFLNEATDISDNYFNFDETTDQISRSYSTTIFYSGQLSTENGAVYTGEIARDLADQCMNLKFRPASDKEFVVRRAA